MYTHQHALKKVGYIRGWILKKGYKGDSYFLTIERKYKMELKGVLADHFPT